MAMIRFIIIYRLASFTIGRYDHKFLRILKKCTHIKGNKAIWNFVKNKIHPEDFSIFNKIRKRDVTLVIYVSEIYFFVSPFLSRKIGCRSEEHTSELQSRGHLVCRLLLEKKKQNMRRS